MMAEMSFVPLVHLIVGTITVISGFAAFAFPKGGYYHKAAGKVFVVSMLLLCASGIYMSIIRSIVFTFFLALFSGYLVLTGWAAMLKKDGGVGIAEKLGLFFSSLCLVALLSLGFAESVFEVSTGGDVPSEAFFFLASVALVFVALDLNLVVRGQLPPKHRLARHLWRMGFSMLIATTIFFLGNSHVLPEMFRSASLLVMPIITVSFLIVFWLVRTLFFARRKAIRTP